MTRLYVPVLTPLERNIRGQPCEESEERDVIYFTIVVNPVIQVQNARSIHPPSLVSRFHDAKFSIFMKQSQCVIISMEDFFN